MRTRAPNGKGMEKLFSFKIEKSTFAKVTAAADEMRITEAEYIRRLIKSHFGETMVLNNGDLATFLGEDDWSRPLYKIFVNDYPYVLAMVDGKLHTITPDGEPIAPVKEVYQPKKEQL